jgi:hypothetical protein
MSKYSRFEVMQVGQRVVGTPVGFVTYDTVSRRVISTDVDEDAARTWARILNQQGRVLEKLYAQARDIESAKRGAEAAIKAMALELGIELEIIARARQTGEDVGAPLTGDDREADDRAVRPALKLWEK